MSKSVFKFIIVSLIFSNTTSGNPFFRDGSFAFVTESLNDKVGIIDVEAPGTFNVIDEPISELFYAGDIVGDGPIMYAINILDLGVYAINLENGGRSLIGITSPGTSEIWSGITADSTNDTVYAVSTTGQNSYLYTLDITTGANTLVGEIVAAPFVMAIAVNSEGVLYGHDITLDALIEIDKLTGTSSLIGSTGYDELFLNGMDFDDSTGILYVVTYSGDNDVIRTINVNTGVSTVIGSVDGDNIFGAFAILPPESDLIFNSGFEPISP